MHSKKHTDVLRKQRYATVEVGELATRPRDDRDTIYDVDEARGGVEMLVNMEWR